MTGNRFLSEVLPGKKARHFRTAARAETRRRENGMRKNRQRRKKRVK